LPDTFEVARYHSLHGIRERLPSCLEVTALTNDGIVMGIQHKTLPFAAVQFHPESILTSPAHGLAILKNALALLKYNQEDSSSGASGSQIVAELEKLSIDELKAALKNMGMSSTGSKSEVVVRLALWKHKSIEAKAGRIAFASMSEEELVELGQALGLKGDVSTKEGHLHRLQACLLETSTI
jgi:hypothetical protein